MAHLGVFHVAFWLIGGHALGLLTLWVILDDPMHALTYYAPLYVIPPAHLVFFWPTLWFCRHLLFRKRVACWVEAGRFFYAGWRVSIALDEVTAVEPLDLHLGWLHWFRAIEIQREDQEPAYIPMTMIEEPRDVVIARLRAVSTDLALRPKLETSAAETYSLGFSPWVDADASWIRKVEHIRRMR